MTPRERIAHDLKALLSDAIGPDRYVPIRDLVAGGVPRASAETLSRASKSVQSSAEADDLADEWAERLDSVIERSVDPAKLAESCPRI